MRPLEVYGTGGRKWSLWREGRRQLSFVSDETESLLIGRERWINSIDSTEMVAQICPNYRRSAKIAARRFSTSTLRRVFGYAYTCNASF